MSMVSSEGVPDDGSGDPTWIDAPPASRDDPGANCWDASRQEIREGDGDEWTWLDRQPPTSDAPEDATTVDAGTMPAGGDFEATDVEASGAGGSASPRGVDGDGTLPACLARRYPVHRYLHTGGQAHVFIAESPEGRSVVIRVARSDVESVEGADISGILHPSIVHVIEAGRADGVDYQVQEYVPGETLRAFLEANARPPESVVRSFVEQMLDALETLEGTMGVHGGHRPIVHADIQPANLICRPDREVGTRYVLIDFGLSYRADHSLMPNARGRTLRYCPPEALLDIRTRAWDWWSIGMIVAEMLLGQHPLGTAPPLTATLAIWHQRYDLSGIADERWLLLVRGLLQNDHDLRWGASEVRAWLGGESPEVYERQSWRGTLASSPLWFAGRAFDQDPRRLADALGSNWAEAARAIGSPEARAELASWARRFHDADLVATIESTGGSAGSLDLDVIRVIGALYAVRRNGGRLGACRSWYHGMQITTDSLRAICAEALTAAEQLVGSSGRPDEVDCPNFDTMLRHATRLVHGDLAVLATTLPPSDPVRDLAERLQAGIAFLDSATTDLDPPREDWEQTLWSIHLLACLASPAARVALREDARAAVRRRPSLRPLVRQRTSPAHHLVATIRARRTPGRTLRRRMSRSNAGAPTAT